MSSGLVSAPSPSVALPAGGSWLRQLIGPAVLPRRFDLADNMNVLRIVLGLLYVPHILYKLAALGPSMAFFTRAGLVPAPFFLGLSLVVETLAAVGLVSGLYTRWIGLLSAGAMAVAAYATIATKGMGWLWNLGGVEYLALWGLISLLLAADAWRKAEAGR
ncbi:DoxX family protein [Roseomonas sp. NAR14]|uniref:DoxX family protein n=1 Tax=Roseomonas acroporae TaxID=2937791 RepID=A0A9X2BXE2_9PROT|nr:DoxX family protein [Roseomonas acroporae]MCK8785864.1 DoxX family protein [Roseomonas acroporae]